MSSSSELWCTRKNGYWKTKNGSDHKKVKWKKPASGSNPEVITKMHIYYVRKTVQYTKTSYKMLMEEEAPGK